jgi:peptidoglycan/xylan/chitin deacetylase (PgdA/CDA1 family)
MAKASRAVVTRRVLLAAGGLTLLAKIAPDHLQPSAPPVSEGPVPEGPVPEGAALPPGTGAGALTSARLPTVSTPPATRPHSHGTRPTRSEPTLPRRPGRGDDDDQPMFHVDDGRKGIALTIDDGPNPIYTPQVLRLLEKYQITATFSMIGIEVDAYPGVARDVAAAGHVIANHTWTHPDLATFPPAAVADQLTRATDAIHKATGRTPALFRAPYGAWSPLVLRYCAQAGMTPLAWSVDPRDWSRPGVPSIVANIMHNTRTGSIILEHDGGGNRSQTVAALKIILPRLLSAGYHFHTP